MTGRLLATATSRPIGRLAYGPAPTTPCGTAGSVRLDDGCRLRLHDPRRLGRVWWSPTSSGSGPTC